jgi:hypothetical protein
VLAPLAGVLIQGIKSTDEPGHQDEDPTRVTPYACRPKFLFTGSTVLCPCPRQTRFLDENAGRRVKSEDPDCDAGTGSQTNTKPEQLARQPCESH